MWRWKHTEILLLECQAHRGNFFFCMQRIILICLFCRCAVLGGFLYHTGGVCLVAHEQRGKQSRKKKKLRNLAGVGASRSDASRIYTETAALAQMRQPSRDTSGRTGQTRTECVRSKVNSPSKMLTPRLSSTYAKQGPTNAKKPESATEMVHHLDQGRHGSRPC